MAESIFTVQTPANPDEDDGTELSLGTRFVSDADGTITHIRWFFPVTPIVGTVNGRLYVWNSDTSGTLLGNADFVAPVAGAWNTAALVPPVPITASTAYVAAVHTPTPYVSTGALFAGPVSNGSHLTATADGPGTANGKFVDADAYPSLSFGSNGYFVDVVFEASSAIPVTGSAGTAGEIDAVFGTSAIKTLDVVPGGETDAVFGTSAIKTVTVGMASESDGAESVSGGDVVTGMAFVDAPCEPWPAMWNECRLPTGSAPFTGSALAAASEVLWAMSGRRFSMCPTTLRPCRETCGTWYDTTNWWNWGGEWPRPRFFQGVWTNVTCGQCLDGCSCTVVSKVRLPMPVGSITNVTIDGVTLDPSAYQLYDYRDLVRQDGGEWPWCNDLSKPAGQPGTWSITAEFGEPVPIMGQWAVAELATEFVKARLCDSSCQLPAPVQQLSRQGVSMTFLDPNEVFANGRLGLRIADMFLSTFNPDGLRAPARVYSVDNPIGRIPT